MVCVSETSEKRENGLRGRGSSISSLFRLFPFSNASYIFDCVNAIYFYLAMQCGYIEKEDIPQKGKAIQPFYNFRK